MADIRLSGRRPTPSLCLVAVLSGLASACANQSVPERPPDRPAVLVEPTSTTPVSAFEDPGTIIVDSDMVCGEVDEGEAELPGSFALPNYANAAAVLLNGWRFEYLSGDHHVQTLGARIEDVAVGPGAINWVARGILADQNGDDAYEFCYVYTVIGWNSGLLDVITDNETKFHSSHSAINNHTTALMALSSALAGRRPVALLPRGFENMYGLVVIGNLDNHVLQVGYHMDHNEAFLEGGKDYGNFEAPDVITNSRIDADHTSWESYGILKDNDLRRDVFFKDFVAILGGRDVAVVSPPFTILPAEDENPFVTCVGDGAVEIEEDVIENVPFDYALPMLTGWDLIYPCDDEHVLDVGVWLQDFSYEKAPNAPTGTLRYTLGSVLRDEEGPPGHLIRHKVNVLGLNRGSP